MTSRKFSASDPMTWLLASGLPDLPACSCRLRIAQMYFCSLRRLCIYDYYGSPGNPYYIMKQLQGALQPAPAPRHAPNSSRPRTRQKWSLDPDFLEQPHAEEERLRTAVHELLLRKFESEKYLEEETFLELLAELTATLAHIPSQLHRLLALEETLPAAGESAPAELKNYVKHFQSLLDAKIRKLKKKEKRTELVEFQLLAKQQPPLRRRPVTYINEDQHHRPTPTTQHDETTPRSFGTMNSIQTDSNSGKNKSGSDSRSGEGNALTVLLANVGRPQQKPKDKQKGRAQRQYDFSSVLSGSQTVRQRHPPTPQPDAPEAAADQDEAFIFHRPKPSRRGQ